jgi:putative hemolysin
MINARLLIVSVAIGATSCAAQPSSAQRANPASEHCVQQSGTLIVERRPDGAEFGVCQFPDNRQCEEWAHMRGQCPAGGIRVTGYVTPGARYCAITGGRYAVTARSGGADEEGACALPGGGSCDANAYYRGTYGAATADSKTAPPPARPQPTSWLDRPLMNWNVAGQPVTNAPSPNEPLADIVSRCRLTPLQSSSGERALTAAGWIPFLPGGDRLVRDDVEIVGGMSGADGMCRPVAYNLFVFVASQFAGTLSPTVMTSRLDGSSGMVQLASGEIDVEFARYVQTDPLCCPSSRVTVRYRIERSERPVIVPVMRTPAAAN